MNAAVHRMQKSAVDSVRERPTAEPELRQLRRRHDPVLAGGDASDQEIHMHNCRIASLPADVRQNCMADVQL